MKELRRSKFVIRKLVVAVIVIAATGSAYGHHSAFVQEVYEALTTKQLKKIVPLFEEFAWKANGKVFSGESLMVRLKNVEIVPYFSGEDDKIRVFASEDRFEARLRCVVAFRLAREEGNSESMSVYLLAKRVSDDGIVNPMAWKIWRIVNEPDQAECFLGSEIIRNRNGNTGAGVAEPND
jgi:hypothetical protein